MNGPSMLHRYGGHGGRPTEWEIRIPREEEWCSKVIQDLPTDFQHIGHSGQHPDQDWHIDWINLPEGVSTEEAGLVLALLSWGESRSDDLVEALRNIDREAS